MKLFFSVLFALVLSACGGGVGVHTVVAEFDDRVLADRAFDALAARDSRSGADVRATKLY